MYSIFFNNRCLQFCNTDSPACLLPDVYVYKPVADEVWAELPVRFECLPHVSHMIVPVPNPQQCFQQACEAFAVLNAAGGIVTNDHQQVLMIYRFGRWDLPKGKQEAGETIETTALREVQEETGIQDLSFCPDAMSTVQLTYHCYRYEGVFTLKKTWWYRMYTSGNETLLPQTEEGIEKAEWVPIAEMPIRLATTYASIKAMMERVSIQ